MPEFVLDRRGKKKVDTDKVRAYVKELESRPDTQTRYRIHDRDEQLWRLEKYVLEEVAQSRKPQADWPSFTSNDPRTLWNALRRAVTSEAPRFRIHLPAVSDAQSMIQFESEMNERNRHERFAVGLWRDIDECRVRQVQLPFQDAIAWHLGIRGGVCIRPWVDPGSPHQFQVPIWDLKTVVWETGYELGLEFVAHHYYATYYDVVGRYPDVSDDIHPDALGRVECIDAWWIERKKDKTEVWNVVLAGGKTVLGPFHHSDLNHLPITIVKTFTPDMEENYYTMRRVSSEWESIYSANAEIYAWMNRIATLYGLYLRNNAIGPYVAEGFPNADATVLAGALRPFNLITAPRPGAKITPVSPPQMAMEAKEFYANLQGSAQRGGVPYSVFGQIPFELSGFAVNQLQGAVSILAGQIAKQMGWAYRLATDELIQQFRSRGKSVTVMGQDQRKQRFIEDIKKSDIREKYYLEVEIKPELPADKLQEAQIAAAWAQLGISPVTIMDEVLRIADPQSELWRMIAWQRIQQETQAKAAAASGPPPGVDSNVLPPEALGQTQQHEQFQPSAQHMPRDESIPY